MSLTERSREQFEGIRERLREEYGDPTPVERTWRHPPGFYDDLVERFEVDHGGGAGTWIYDDGGRVLLVREGPTGWTDPGDKRSAGERFEETARRAVREATGAEVEITDALELHEVTVYDGTDPDRPHLIEPIVVFAARHVGGDPEPVGEGIEAVRWFEEPPRARGYEEVGERPIPFDPE